MLHGNFGTSLANGESVSSLIGARPENSAVLVIGAEIVGTLLAGILGLIAAARRDRLFDHIASVIALTIPLWPASLKSARRQRLTPAAALPPEVDLVSLQTRSIVCQRPHPRGLAADLNVDDPTDPHRPDRRRQLSSRASPRRRVSSRPRSWGSRSSAWRTAGRRSRQQQDDLWAEARSALLQRRKVTELSPLTRRRVVAFSRAAVSDQQSLQNSPLRQ